MKTPSASFGTTRERGPTVSYPEIERAARALMAAGDRPTGHAVLKYLGRGSPNHITEALRRFWKDQAALNAGDPLALSRLPPELAEAAVAQWEQALRLAQQTVNYESSVAKAQLKELKREADAKVRSVELREKEWDMAARIRDRALADAREQINVLLRELALDRAQLRAGEARIVDLEGQLDEQRRQLANIITRLVVRNRRKLGEKKAPKAKSQATRDLAAKSLSAAKSSSKRRKHKRKR